MRSPTPRVPEPTDPALPGADIHARLTVELVSAVSAARRRAHRDGDAQIDTAHLLHSLLETDPEVRDAFSGGPQVARVLGYLVQRSIGYGLRWHGTVEDSGAVPALPVLRDRPVTGWSPPAVAAMRSAVRRSVRRGEQRTRGLDLLAALVADRSCRAVDVLERAGVDALLLSSRLSVCLSAAPGRG